jgi:regulator of replication initiation timing
MAKQVQFRGATKSKGFSPQQVSDAAISRMREDSNRTLQGMREAARADIEQRQRISAEVKANQQYEKGAREKNFQIQTQNQQTQLRQTQLDSQTALEQLEIDQAAQTKIFENVANLSQTAAKKYEEIQKVKSDERAQQAINEFLINPNQDEVIRQVLGEYELAATEEVRQSELDVAQARNADPVAVSKARSLDSNGRYKLDQARVNYILTNIYPQQLNKALLDAGDLDSAQTAAFVTNFQREFFERSNVLAYKPEMLRDGLTALAGVNQGIQTKAQNREIKIKQGIAVDNATTILTQNPSAFNQNIVSSFNTIVRNNGSDYQKGYEWLEGLATQRGVNGEYLFTLDQIANATVNKGQPFAVSNPGRMGAIKMARERGDTQYRSAQIQADDLRYKEDEKRFLQGLTQDNSKEFAEEALLFFQESYGKVPQSIQKFANSYTYDALAKAKKIEELESLPDGDITLEAVDVLSGLDPVAGKALDARYQKQQVIVNNPAFKEQIKALEGTINTKTDFGTVKTGEEIDVLVKRYAARDLRNRVRNELGDFKNSTPRQIAISIDNNALAIGEEIRQAKGKYAAGKLGPGLRRTFPLLEKASNLSSAEKYARSYSDLKAAVRASPTGIRGVLTKKDAVMTTPETEAASDIYLETGEYPLRIQALVEMSNGGDPFVFMNEIRKAQGLTPLEPPQLLKDLNAQMTPESSALLNSAYSRRAAKLRAMRQGFSQTSGNTSTFQRPGAMRSGSMFKRSFTGAMMYSDNPQEYVQTGEALVGLGFKVAEHPAFGGTAPVHAGNSYHGYGEAFDVTHQTGEYNASIEKTRQLKDAIRSMGLFEEIIGPGDGDPNHETHLHLGGLMRPITPQDIETLKSLFN